MKPTVYLRLADLCPTGVRRASASSVARFGAGRISAHRLWIEMDGQRVGTNEQRKQSAGGSEETRTR